jgi:hypothetical protein
MVPHDFHFWFIFIMHHILHKMFLKMAYHVENDNPKNIYLIKINSYFKHFLIYCRFNKIQRKLCIYTV